MSRPDLDLDTLDGLALTFGGSALGTDCRQKLKPCFHCSQRRESSATRLSKVLFWQPVHLSAEPTKIFKTKRAQRSQP